MFDVPTPQAAAVFEEGQPNYPTQEGPTQFKPSVRASESVFRLKPPRVLKHLNSGPRRRATGMLL